MSPPVCTSIIARRQTVNIRLRRYSAEFPTEFGRELAQATFAAAVESYGPDAGNPAIRSPCVFEAKAVTRLVAKFPELLSNVIVLADKAEVFR